MKRELAELIVSFPEKLGQVDIERIPALDDFPFDYARQRGWLVKEANAHR